MAKKEKYSIDFKKKVIGYAQLHNIITAADYYRLGRNTIANWIKQFKEQGTEGLVRKIKSKDKQPKKLDDKILDSILKFKQENPKTTLTEIKKEFNLDCSLTLISRKLKRINSKTKVRDLSKFKPIQSFNVYINVLSKVNIKGQSHSLYQINIEDNISQSKFIGYSLEKNSMNISLFIDYILSRLEDKGLINANYEIQTNIPNLKRNEKEDINIRRFVTSKHNTSLAINKNLNTSQSNIEIESELFSHNNLIKSIYKELILGKGAVNSKGYLYSENIIIPPIFVDSFIQDIDKIVRFTDFWKTASLPNKQNQLLLDTLSEIEEYGDQAQIDFDFEKAINIYHKILLTGNNCKNSEELRSQVNLKQGKVYYHIDQFDMSEKLLVDSIELSTKYSFYHELGESYHYMGMIYFRRSESDKADTYYKKAIKTFLNSNTKDDIFGYYESQTKKSINLLKYKEALEFVEKYIQEAKSKENFKQLSQALGMKSSIYYYMNNYKKSEKILLEQGKLARKIGNKILEAKNIIALLNLYTYALKKGHNDIVKLFNELKRFSKKIKKDSYLASAYTRLGVYFYKKEEYKKAESFLRNAMKMNKKFGFIDSYIENMHYLGNLFYKKGEYHKALKFFNKVKKTSTNKSIFMYEIYAENALGRSYFYTDKFEKSINCLNRSIKIANKYGYNYLMGNSLMYLGKIYKCRKKNKKAIECFNQSVEIFNHLNESSKYLNIDDDIKTIMKELKVLRK